MCATVILKPLLSSIVELYLILEIAAEMTTATGSSCTRVTSILPVMMRAGSSLFDRPTLLRHYALLGVEAHIVVGIAAMIHNVWSPTRCSVVGTFMGQSAGTSRSAT